jgi:transcription elongation GreA/GreB family factor
LRYLGVTKPFQIVALLAMEAPAGRNYGFVHDEKAKVRRCARSTPAISPLARLLIGKRVGEAVELDGREIEVVTID